MNRKSIHRISSKGEFTDFIVPDLVYFEVEKNLKQSNRFIEMDAERGDLIAFRQGAVINGTHSESA